MIAYQDLDLRLQADGDKFRVFAQLGSQSADAPFALDLSGQWDLWDLPAGDPKEIEERGAALFNALITESVRDLYQQARGGSGSDTSKGMRIRIRIDSREERLRPLVRLPWEILCDRSVNLNRAVALDPRRPIVRTIDSNEPSLDPAPLPIRRVLLALAQPTDTGHLSLTRECSDVQTVLRQIGIEPVVVRPATRSSLREAIAEEQPQIVHFMGHGTFDPGTREGVLLLENEKRTKDPLHASALARFFTGKPAPRLVILTSCLTGVPGREETFEPFATVSAALIAAGLPAVIAMRSEVRDKNARRFTGSFYRALVRGEPVEAAVSEARSALYDDDRQSLDWATPALFVRAHGGGDMNITSPPPARPAEPRVPEPPPRQINQHGSGLQIIGDVGHVTYNKHEK